MFGIFTRRYRKSQQQAEADADALIARYGERAYSEARQRSRLARQGTVMDGDRPAAHWDCVRVIIGRKTGRDGVDTATRYLSLH